MEKKLEDLIVYECEEYLEMIMVDAMSGEESVQRVARDTYEEYKKRYEKKNNEFRELVKESIKEMIRENEIIFHLPDKE